MKHVDMGEGIVLMIFLQKLLQVVAKPMAISLT